METHGFVGKCAHGIAASLPKSPCLHPVHAPPLTAALFQFHF